MLGWWVGIIRIWFFFFWGMSRDAFFTGHGMGGWGWDLCGGIELTQAIRFDISDQSINQAINQSINQLINK